MKSVQLTQKFETDHQVYAQVYEALRAPNWAGYNKDALYDILTTQVEGDFEIIWPGVDLVLRQGPRVLADLVQVFEDAAQDCPRMRFVCVQNPA